MVELARQITLAIVSEFSSQVFLKKLSDPYWFQAFGCVLGFDWHSSGLTTTTCGALKEGLRGLEKDIGILVAGGKGGTSRRTPQELEFFGQKFSFDSQPLIYASKISAKVDSGAVQDGYQLYHHSFFTSLDGQDWAVVQQGMNSETHTARRYHWLSDGLEDFVCEPHTGIVTQVKADTLDLTAKKSGEARKVITRISTEKPEETLKTFEKLRKLDLPRHHHLFLENLHSQSIKKALLSTYERRPADFEKLLSLRGVGPKTIRALSLVSELVYGEKPSYEDPAKFSFAHGGKDGHPYPVNKKVYDKTIKVMKLAVGKARVGRQEKMGALRQLHLFYG